MSGRGTESERLRVRSDVSRCPFCHDDVELEAIDWLVCRRCLARHHRACWREAGRCASCGGESHLGLSTRSARRLTAWRDDRSWRWQRKVGGLAALSLGAVALTTWILATGVQQEALDAVGARATRQEILVDHHAQEVTALRAELERAREDLTTLRVRSESRSRADEAWIEGLLRDRGQLQVELAVARERLGQQLLELGSVAEGFPVLAEGVAAMQRGSYLTALSRFEEAIEERPADGYIRACRATARHALGDFEGALDDLDHALDLDPSLLIARYHRGHVLFAQGRHRAAQRELRELLEDLPADAAASPLRRRAQALLGELAQAR